MVNTIIMRHSRVSSSTRPCTITRSTMRPDNSGMMRAMVLLTQNSTIAPATRGRSGLQYGRIHLRLPASVFRFGSTYIRGVPSDCLLGYLGFRGLLLRLFVAFTAIRCRYDSRPSFVERPVAVSLSVETPVRIRKRDLFYANRFSTQRGRFRRVEIAVKSTHAPLHKFTVSAMKYG